jgi:hypothetical protein
MTVSDYKVSMTPKDSTKDKPVNFTIRATSVMDAADQARAQYPDHNLTTYPWKLN